MHGSASSMESKVWNPNSSANDRQIYKMNYLQMIISILSPNNENRKFGKRQNEIIKDEYGSQNHEEISQNHFQNCI